MGTEFSGNQLILEAPWIPVKIIDSLLSATCFLPVDFVTQFHSLVLCGSKALRHMGTLNNTLQFATICNFSRSPVHS